MSETMYITGVVIANGIPDSEGDVLDKKDIKTIFTKYLDQSADVQHDRVKHDGIDVLANWISEVDIEIAGQVAPAGSWLTTLAVTNEEVKAAVNESELTGLSLGSVSEDALTRDKWFINKSVSYKAIVDFLGINKSEQKTKVKTYSDLDSIEEVHPFWISLVDKPSNKFGFEVSDYTTYINKRASDAEVDTMAINDKEIEDRISISGWGKIKDMFQANNESINKNETEPTTQKEVVEEEASDISNKELLEAMPEVIAEGFKAAIAELKKSEETDEEKDDDDSINKSETGPIDNDTAINKRQSSMQDNISNPVPQKSFNERHGRDHLGRKIR